MSADDDEETGVEQELALDLWEGQFEFVGEGYASDGGGLENGGGRLITPPPRLGSNGVRKTEAHLWCEDLTEQVSGSVHGSSIMNQKDWRFYLVEEEIVESALCALLLSDSRTIFILVFEWDT
ncbi:hypothetical protein C0J52_05403 [Blattella germanica]|nr:hypothetical protein C0J52_05403 [Blattella germanica]